MIAHRFEVTILRPNGATAADVMGRLTEAMGEAGLDGTVVYRESEIGDWTVEVIEADA